MKRLKVVILALLTLRGLAQRILILILKKGIKIADLTEGQIAQCMKVARTIAPRIPRMATTISNSTSVNAFFIVKPYLSILFLTHFLQYRLRLVYALEQ